MKQGVQSFYLSLGNEACYFLDLLEIAERETGIHFDPLSIAWICSQKGYLYINWKDLKDTENFKVENPCEILKLLTGITWSITRVDNPIYKPKAGDYVIAAYKNGNFTHFVLQSFSFDSLQNSLTVKNGKINSYRVFRKMV